jgi:putative addiction module killer protein
MGSRSRNEGPQATTTTQPQSKGELRIDWGPGYRVYYAIQNQRVILLCEGGDKRTQAADIKRAVERWQDWQRRRKT